MKRLTRIGNGAWTMVVAAEPDGPLGRFDPAFAIGASWSHDPGPDYDSDDRGPGPKLKG